MPLKKIPSSSVEKGMYVSRLDRPWTETPFLFQGFEVQTSEELNDIKRLTEFVFIIVDEDLTQTRNTSSSADRNATQKSATNDDHMEVEEIIATSIDDEIENVRSAHESVVELFDEISNLIQAGGTLRLESFERPVKAMVSSVVKNPDAYIWLTRLKKFDSFLYRDSLTASILATALGRQLDMSEEILHNLATGCMLMDVGKLSLPSEILNKKERLSADEWTLMKTHVDLGLEMLDSCPNCNPLIRDIVLTHHERINGSGYPNGLQGNQISMYGQIGGIVDTYVAVTSPRPYATTISPSKAEQLLYKERGRLFDEILVEYFIRTLCAYPTGSLVELSTGEVAIVKNQKSGLQLKPDVILLLDSNKQPYGSYTVMALDNYTSKDLPVTIVRTLAYGEYGLDIEDIFL